MKLSMYMVDHAEQTLQQQIQSEKTLRWYSIAVLKELCVKCHICYARTLGTFLLALWRSDCLLYGYGIVRMRVAIPGTL